MISTVQIPLRSDLRYSGIFLTDVSGQIIGAIFKGQELQDGWNHAYSTTFSSQDIISSAVKYLARGFYECLWLTSF